MAGVSKKKGGGGEPITIKIRTKGQGNWIQTHYNPIKKVNYPHFAVQKNANIYFKQALRWYSNTKNDSISTWAAGR